MGRRPMSFATSASIPGSAPGSPGPLLRNIPWKRGASSSEAGVSQGKTSKCRPEACSNFRMEALMPPSSTDTRNFASSLGISKRSLQLTSAQRAWPIMSGIAAALARPSSTPPSDSVQIKAGCEPTSRRCWVRARVSSSVIKGTWCRFNQLPRSLSDRAWSGVPEIRRQIIPLAQGLGASCSPE